MKTKELFRFAAPVLVLVSTAANAAGGYSISLSQAVNMEGKNVPEVVIEVDRASRSLDRATVQASIKSQLARAGVRPDLIALQSVATAALNMASDRYEGVDTICYETWCARVFLAT